MQIPKKTKKLECLAAFILLRLRLHEPRLDVLQKSIMFMMFDINGKCPNFGGHFDLLPVDLWPPYTIPTKSCSQGTSSFNLVILRWTVHKLSWNKAKTINWWPWPQFFTNDLQNWICQPGFIWPRAAAGTSAMGVLRTRRLEEDSKTFLDLLYFITLYSWCWSLFCVHAEREKNPENNKAQIRMQYKMVMACITCKTSKTF